MWLCVLCGCVWLCVVVCGCVWLCVVVCGCVCISSLVLEMLPSVRSKRSRVYFQNARVTSDTDVFEGTHERVLNVNTREYPPLFSCLSLSLSSSLSSLFSMQCVMCVCVVCGCCWLCVWLWLWLCVCVRVPFLLGLKNAPVCSVKTLPGVLSKHPCDPRHGRFESTHGSVSGSHSLALPLSLSRLSLFSCLSLSLFLLDAEGKGPERGHVRGNTALL